MAGTDRLRDLVIQKLDVYDYYTRVEALELTDLGAGQYTTACVFHDDHEPSMTIGPGGVFYCFTCKAKGSVFDFYMKRHACVYTEARRALAEHAGVDSGENNEPIPESEIDKWYEALLKNKTWMKFLHEERGYTDETIKLYRLGFDGERITIPVYDKDGNTVNIRRYLPKAKSGKQKMIGYRVGMNKARIFLEKNIQKNGLVIICEGETDAILLNQEQFNAITVTSGAGTWRAEWTLLFKDKTVILMFDNDLAGREGMDRVGRFLHGTAAVHIVQWPTNLKEKGDITDFIVGLGHNREDVQQLIDDAKLFAPSEVAIKDPNEIEYTDVGNGRRLVKKFGDIVRYCHLWGSWLIWDGRHWLKDEVQMIEQYAKAVALQIRVDAPQEDLDRYKELVKFSLRTEASSRIRALIELAESEESIAIHPDSLDTDPWLLSCQNGTIDLRTGELRESKRDDLITKLAPVDYDPKAKSKVWDKFLSESTAGDKELSSFVQRAVGYSLTGDTSEEKLFFIHGPAATGKSTFLEAIKATLGTYAMTTNFSTFLENRDSGEHKGDIARMKGARLIVSIEVEEGKKLAEGLVKQLTGGDKITARFLYKEAFEFGPTAKLWLSANHKPKVSDEDDAIWRRILMIPFEQIVPKEKRDPKIKQQLIDPSLHGSAILAWAIQGCLSWQKSGLGKSKMIDDATRVYRAEQDPLADWLQECTIAKEGVEVDNKFLVHSYLTWCKDNGIRFPLTGRAISTRLSARGFDLVKISGHQSMRRGLSLVGDAKRDAEQEREF